jgi:hypothetical protein
MGQQAHAYLPDMVSNDITRLHVAPTRFGSA